MYLSGGGSGWTGATTCVSGYVCTVSNPCERLRFLLHCGSVLTSGKDYSQCTPGTATSTKTTATSTKPTSTSTGGSTPPKSTTLPFLGGVNTAGYDFTVTTDGSFTGTGVSPPTGQYQHFASEGVNIFRIPFAWQLMTPTLGGTVSSSFLAKYDATVNAALSASTAPYVIIDLHSSFLSIPRALLRPDVGVQTTLAGTVASLDRAAPPTPSTPRSGRSLLPTTRATRRSFSAS
jgi:endoglucanase